jgi:hypothetical protein
MDKTSGYELGIFPDFSKNCLYFSFFSHYINNNGPTTTTKTTTTTKQ